MAGDLESRGQTRDATGRQVRLLDPYPLWLRGRFEPIAEEALNAIVSDLGVPNKGRKTVYLWVGFIVVVLVITVGGIGASVIIEGRPALDDLVSTLMNPVFMVGPIGGFVAAIIATRAQRMSKVRKVLLGHGHCPHCGYRIAELPGERGVVRCPECSCAWPGGELGAPTAGLEGPDTRVRAVAVLTGVVLLAAAVAGLIVMMLR